MFRALRVITKIYRNKLRYMQTLRINMIKYLSYTKIYNTCIDEYFHRLKYMAEDVY